MRTRRGIGVGPSLEQGRRIAESRSSGDVRTWGGIGLCGWLDFWGLGAVRSHQRLRIRVLTFLDQLRGSR